MKQKKGLLPCGVLCACSLATGGALAGDVAKVFDEVSVTATRETRATGEVPQAISVVGKETLADKKIFNVKEALQEVPGVIAASPIIDGEAMVTAKGVAAGALVRGIGAEDLAARGILNGRIKEGSLAGFGEDEIAIGYRLAQKLKLDVGDRLTLVAPNFPGPSQGNMPRTRAFTIGALFDIGMADIDAAYVLLPLSAAQEFFRLPEAASGIEVVLEDPERTQEFRLLVVSRLGPGYRPFDWQQANAGIMDMVAVQRNVLFLILALIVLVAAFNIVSSLIMLVKSKTHDVAILRTMGASAGAVMRVFFMSGAAIGVLGTIAGFGVGVAFALNIESIRRWIESVSGTELFSAEIYFFSQLPARVEPAEVGAIVAMGLALSFLATLYPSWRAARLDPIEALRHE